MKEAKLLKLLNKKLIALVAFAVLCATKGVFDFAEAFFVNSDSIPAKAQNVPFSVTLQAYEDPDCTTPFSATWAWAQYALGEAVGTTSYPSVPAGASDIGTYVGSDSGFMLPSMFTVLGWTVQRSLSIPTGMESRS